MKHRRVREGQACQCRQRREVLACKRDWLVTLGYWDPGHEHAFSYYTTVWCRQCGALWRVKGLNMLLPFETSLCLWALRDRQDQYIKPEGMKEINDEANRN